MICRVYMQAVNTTHVSSGSFHTGMAMYRQLARWDAPMFDWIEEGAHHCLANQVWIEKGPTI
jgi:hypothetical protein